jgi:hypothetical protein
MTLLSGLLFRAPCASFGGKRRVKMTEIEILTATILAGATGGAWGAYKSGSRAWIGATVILVGTIATLVLSALIDLNNPALTIPMNLLFVGIIGGAMRMTWQQIGYTLLSAFIVTLVVMTIVGFFT